MVSINVFSVIYRVPRQRVDRKPSLLPVNRTNPDFPPGTCPGPRSRRSPRNIPWRRFRCAARPGSWGHVPARNSRCASGRQVLNFGDGFIPACAGNHLYAERLVSGQGSIPHRRGNPYCQMIVISTISKITMPDEPHLSSSHQEDPVRVNDLLRGFPEGRNAETSDCLLVSPQKDDRSRAQRRPPV